MKATNEGILRPLDYCYVTIMGSKITLNNLPDVTDTKNAVYNSEAVIGRSAPMYTYSHSGDRIINMQFHFFVIESGDVTKTLGYLRLLESAVYPRPSNGVSPYEPPPICQIKCGQLLAEEEICVVLQTYSVKFPTEVPWADSEGGRYLPYRLDVDTSWLVVYTSSGLPWQGRIVKSGY